MAKGHNPIKSYVQFQQMAYKYHIKKFPTTCWLSGEDIVWCRATNEEGAKTFVNFSTTISDVSGALFILISILLNSKELQILTVLTCCHFVFVVLPDFAIAHLVLFCYSWSSSYFQCLHLCKMMKIRCVNILIELDLRRAGPFILSEAQVVCYFSTLQRIFCTKRPNLMRGRKSSIYFFKTTNKLHLFTWIFNGNEVF